MIITIDEVTKIFLCKEMNGEFILQLSDFNKNDVELGFDRATLELLYFKLREEFGEKK